MTATARRTSSAARNTVLFSVLLLVAGLLLPVCGVARAGGRQPSAVAAADTAALQENLTYDIVYHWGLIWKKAAVGTLSIARHDSCYRAVMTARTLSFADFIFKVRDTLVADMRAIDLQPLHFVKIAREGKFYQIDSLTYTHRNDSTLGHTVLTRPGKDFREVVPMAVQGDAYDMLSVFYRVRQLPFYRMQAGDMFSTPLFSGRNIEQLDIEYMGTDTIEVLEQPCEAYYLRFRFYDRNGKKTSDKISAWLSTDDYIPLRLEGRLPIGTMKVMLVSGR